MLLACSEPTGHATPPGLAAIVIAPDSDSVQVGSSVPLRAILVDSAGDTVQGRVTWSSSDSGVARVSGAGVVTGVAAGTTWIVAASGALSDTAGVRVWTPRPPPPPRGVHYVSPGGTAGNDGSQGAPWDLVTALAGAGGRIVPGDTVWLLNGTYPGAFETSLAGAPGNPIVFREYPGERATIDGGLRVDGPDVVFWGFEIMQSQPLQHGKLPTLETHGARSRFINLAIHDAAQQGVTFWDGAEGGEVYGCIIYNNGTHENLDHGVYVHNSGATKRLTDNVLFDNLAYGIHVYADTVDPPQRNVDVSGNVAFNNGTISTRYPAKGDILVATWPQVSGIRIAGNLTYFSQDSAGVGLTVGFDGADNQDAEVSDNVIAGGATALEFGPWQKAVVRDNLVAGSQEVLSLLGSAPTTTDWGGNRYYHDPGDLAWGYRGSAYSFSGWRTATGLGTADSTPAASPTTPWVMVRPNRYEPGRGLVVVFNWSGAVTALVPLDSVVTPGASFAVHNVQDLFGAPVASGTFNGGWVVLPMTGVAPPAPLGRTTPTPPRTGPLFDVFLVTSPSR